MGKAVGLGSNTDNEGDSIELRIMNLHSKAITTSAERTFSHQSNFILLCGFHKRPNLLEM